jgi:hypothetical protein
MGCSSCGGGVAVGNGMVGAYRRATPNVPNQVPVAPVYNPPSTPLAGIKSPVSNDGQKAIKR